MNKKIKRESFALKLAIYNKNLDALGILIDGNPILNEENHNI